MPSSGPLQLLEAGGHVKGLINIFLKWKYETLDVCDPSLAAMLTGMTHFLLCLVF